MATLALLAGCAGQQRDRVDTDAPAPAYLETARAYNERANRLERVWARAVVEVRYVDQDGRRRSEQGDGHLQLLAPDRLALSLGKLGEMVLYLGCDDTRHWLFERGEPTRVAVGLHENLGRPCARSLGLPAHPLDIIDLLGVTPLPEREGAGRTSWARDGTLAVETPGRLGTLRVLIDPATHLPVRMEMLDAPGGEAWLTADLQNHERLAVRAAAFGPHIATRIIIRHAESDTELRVNLYDPSDGIVRGRIAEDVFDFEYLLDALNAGEVDVLDEDCQQAAIAQRPE
ncbi:MAG: hypothetical protein EA379_05795 [Phycisphaerales bacterium]|nr:MAG: hypothetical protein EA379_05795 [Phycisphaerales bacterium]